MKRRLTLIYWKGDKFWLGKLLEYPEIMTQGETIEELEENIKDACLLMAMDDVPDGYRSKEIAKSGCPVDPSKLSKCNSKGSNRELISRTISAALCKTGRFVVLPS